MDPLEKVIRPVVEGQIRSFINDHPEVVGAVNWYKPRPDKAQTLVNSLAKRIVRDLLCSDNRVRLVQALLEQATVEPKLGALLWSGAD